MAKKLTPKEFVSRYYDFARQTEEKTGIDSRFTLAQAALETGWSGSCPGNMFFGIKADPRKYPPQQRQLLRTREVLSRGDAVFPEVISVRQLPGGRYEYVVKDWFRRYETPEGSFTDHADFFFRNKRYAAALGVKSDPYLFAEEISRAGYATDPGYADALKSVIRTIENNLPL